MIQIARSLAALLAGAGLLMGLVSCGTEKNKKGQPPVSEKTKLPWEPPPPTTGGMGGMPREPRR